MSNRYVRNSKDRTLERNSIKQWKFLIDEYLLVKKKKHPKFSFANEFYKYYNVKKQNFIKYYNRYKLSIINNCSIEEINESLLPEKRGPKYLKGRTIFNQEIIDKIKELRLMYGMNRYNIRNELEIYFNNKYNNSLNNINDNNNNKDNINRKINIPSYSSIYNILKRYNMNILNNEMEGNNRKEIKRYIKDNIGELGHIDCHYLPKNIIEDEKDNKNRYYLIGLIDDKSRILALTLSKDITALTVMFKTLEMINFFKNIYGIEFKEILTDNGPEFGSGKQSKNKDNHPFERLLQELNIKHRYSKPYHPQTNGKIERVWRIIDDELLDGMIFDNEEHLKEEIMKYNLYYNDYRIHTSLNNKTPKQYLLEEYKRLEEEIIKKKE